MPQTTYFSPAGRGWHAEKRFALSLGLPEDATSDCARVTLSGQSAALVEGQHGVIELTESRVRLRTGRGVLTVQGEGLRLRRRPSMPHSLKVTC